MRKQQDVNTEDYGICPSNDDNVRVALVSQDVQNAFHLATAGWPPYRGLYGRAAPAPFLRKDSQIAGLGALGHRATYNRAEGRDIVSRALATVGAEKVGPAGWLMMDERGDLFSPMVGLDFAVCRISTFLVRDHCNFYGPWGVRLGPRARGPLAQRLRGPKKMPPGTKKASPR